jgi:integrator complex subunit 3
LGFDERKGIENSTDDVVVEDSTTVTEQVVVEDKPETSEEPGNIVIPANDELQEVVESVEAGGEEMGDGSEPEPEPEPKGVSTADMQMLSEPQQHWLGVLIESRDKEMRKKAVDRLFEEVSSAVDIDKESVDIIAKGVAQCLLDDFSDSCSLDQNMSDVGKNLPHSLFEFVNPDRPATIYRRVLGFLDKLREYEPRIGYHLLFYLKAKVVSGRTDQLAFHHSLSVDLTVYHDLAKMSESSHDFEDLVLGDLEACQSDDSNLFYFLLPEIYKQFPETFLGSSQLLYLTVSCIDSVQLNDLICQLSLNSFKMFGEERVVEAIKVSLEWETFEQFSVWQLLSAEVPPLQEILKILPLDSNAHPEALSGLLFLLRSCQ